MLCEPCCLSDRSVLVRVLVVNFNMADKQNTWRKFQEKMKDKRTAKKATKPTKGNGQENERGELIVQRLSAEVHGKAQKYSRVGPRDFVDFANIDMTVENIKKACTAHFKGSIGVGMVCDILAGDQGPSCRTVKQIPNLKLIHIRFIPESDVEVLEDTKIEGCPSTSIVLARSVSPPPRLNKKPKVAPKSLSVSTILQLGRLVQPKTTLVNLFSFHFESLTWSTVPVPVEITIDPDVLGEGGFRKAYRATTVTKEFSHATWVIKRYKSEALEEIEKINESVDNQTKKVIQMHHLAQHFTQNITKQVEEDACPETFGPTLKYRTIYFGKMASEECVSVEEFVDGTFTKYINNDGCVCEDQEDELVQKAECLSHFSYLQ